QDIMEEISLTIDEAKLKKMADEMLRQRCTSGDEHQMDFQMGVENWKNPHAKVFYIRRQKEPGKPKEEIYSNSKIVQVIKTFWELGHEHKFITEIVARRANDCILSIEGLKSYSNDVKYGYVQKELTNDEVEFLKLFIEEIEDRLKYRDKMRRWEMIAMVSVSVHQEFSDMGKSARFSTWNRKLSTED
ncbi:hypothetical protein Tco_1206458, partial [Tanacetum coccineum]